MKGLWRDWCRQADLTMKIFFIALIAGFGFSLGAVICIGLLGNMAGGS